MKRGRLMDSGYAVLGSLGWLCVPKCPACLMASIAALTGITIPFAQGQTLRVALLGATAGLFFIGTWRLRRRGLLLRRACGGCSTAADADR